LRAALGVGLQVVAYVLIAATAVVLIPAFLLADLGEKVAG
jgi:hypothetical protein